MNIQRTVIVMLLILTGLSTANSKDYALRRKVDGFTMDVSINQNPPILGKNDIRIEIKDPAGKQVVNAPVTVNFYMPPMPGMPPMNYTVKAVPRGPAYSATMIFIMAGPWNIVIKTVANNKQLRISVPIDVR